MIPTLETEYTRKGNDITITYKGEVLTVIDMSPDYPWLDFAGQKNKLPVNCLHCNSLIVDEATKLMVMLSRFHNTPISKRVRLVI